jgi:hypothetical protein
MLMFRREVTCDRMGITPRQRDLCLDILQQIVHSTSADIYNEKYRLLEETGITAVIDYYKKNWENVKEEFVECFSAMNLTFGNRTSVRPESVKEKIKNLCLRSGTLVGFYRQLLTVVNMLRSDCDQRAQQTLKRPASQFPSDSLEGMFHATVTPYAFSLLKPHIDSYRSVRVEREISSVACEVPSSMGMMITTIDVCPCLFRISTGLPCKHILAVRAIKRIKLFDRHLIADRWTREYYVGHQREIQSEANLHDDDHRRKPRQRPRQRPDPVISQVISAQQQYREATAVAHELATLLAEAPLKHYASRLSQIEWLREAWRADEETCVDVLYELPGSGDMRFSLGGDGEPPVKFPKEAFR